MDVKYYIKNNIKVAMYIPTNKTIVIEISKDIISIRPSNIGRINFIKLYEEIF